MFIGVITFGLVLIELITGIESDFSSCCVVVV